MDQLKDKPIAIPGNLTTANLLLQLYGHGLDRVVPMPFDQILGAVARGDFVAGVIIHESRFTYAEYDLKKVLDLGQWWEEETGFPIPLGGILAKRTLDKKLVRILDDALRASVDYAFAHPEEPCTYIRQHAQEMDPQVIDSHIGLYVNQFSRDLGEEGLAAVRMLLKRAEKRGIIPPSHLPLLAD